MRQMDNFFIICFKDDYTCTCLNLCLRIRTVPTCPSPLSIVGISKTSCYTASTKRCTVSTVAAMPGSRRHLHCEWICYAGILGFQVKAGLQPYLTPVLLLGALCWPPQPLLHVPSYWALLLPQEPRVQGKLNGPCDWCGLWVNAQPDWLRHHPCLQ